MNGEGIIDDDMRKHVTGTARFVDDQVPRRGMLEVWPVLSPHASALITRRDARKARDVEGVRAVLLAEDVPGLNHIGAIRDDEPLLADSRVFFGGQIVGLVVGASSEICRRAAQLVEVDYQPLPAVLTIEQAIAVSSYHTEAQVIRSGDCEGALAAAPNRFRGRVSSGGQEHFYPETQVAWAEPIEGRDICVQVSSQHPSQIQALVADVLGRGKNSVRVESRRVGGGFGGKETQAHTWAALAALAAYATGAPVRVCLNRRQDMALTGKRHAFYADYEAGFEDNGRLCAVRVALYANGGWSLDLSGMITERALLHLDSAYHIPNALFSGRVCKTNLASNTSCMGSGVAEAALVMEEILDRVAFETGVTGEEARRVNLYGRAGNPATTPYGQRVAARSLRAIWDQILKSSAYVQRSEEIAAFNRGHDTSKRGIGIVPVKLGAGFPVRTLNQGGALVNVLTDGSVQVNHGGVESGQGINARMRIVASRILGIPEERIRVMDASTEKVPNTSATSFSAGSDLNGRAVRAACEAIVERMRPVAAQLLHEKGAPVPEAGDLEFAGGFVGAGSESVRKVAIDEVIFYCWRNRISLSATGFHRSPQVNFDRETGQGQPFQHFAIGAAVSEVEIDGLTGESRVLRADILQDAGASPAPAIDRTQIEGGFVMGMGWLTSEELLWDRDGILWTDSAARYKVPTIADVPDDFRVELWQDAGESAERAEEEIREVGEAGVALALSVRAAMKAAVGAFGRSDLEVELDAPATPESVYRAIAVRGGWAPPAELPTAKATGPKAAAPSRSREKEAARRTRREAPAGDDETTEVILAEAGSKKAGAARPGALPLKKSAGRVDVPPPSEAVVAPDAKAAAGEEKKSSNVPARGK